MRVEDGEDCRRPQSRPRVDRAGRATGPYVRDGGGKDPAEETGTWDGRGAQGGRLSSRLEGLSNLSLTVPLLSRTYVGGVDPRPRIWGVSREEISSLDTVRARSELDTPLESPLCTYRKPVRRHAPSIRPRGVSSVSCER